MYKHYARIKNGVVLDYPVDPRVWDVTTNSYNIDEYWEGGELDGNEYVFCHNLEPEYQYDETLVEKTPEFDPQKNLWVRKYDTVKVSAEVLAKRRVMAQQTVDEIMANLRQDLVEMQSTIVTFTENRRKKWAAYAEQIEAMPLQPNYPFQYVVPKRPDLVQDLKIEVTRI